VIDRSMARDNPNLPLAEKAASVFGARVAETILASVHMRAQQQAGHMNASDLVTAQSHLAGAGPSTYGR
jgi:hypothetical protein